MSLDLQDLHKTYADGTHAVRGIDLSCGEGELVVLLGPSGCGKTTTLRIVAGLEEPTSGVVELDGTNVTRLPPQARDVGFVFQFYALYPHMKVIENVGFPLECSGLSRTERRQIVEPLLARLGLASLADRYPRQLSGGDQQRVSLATLRTRGTSTGSF